MLLLSDREMVPITSPVQMIKTVLKYQKYPFLQSQVISDYRSSSKKSLMVHGHPLNIVEIPFNIVLC